MSLFYCKKGTSTKDEETRVQLAFRHSDIRHREIAKVGSIQEPQLHFKKSVVLQKS